MLHVILYQPEIPPNTGNIIRLCANTGTRLHLVGPLGFALDEKRLRRAGLDYHDLAEVAQYRDWTHFLAEQPKLPLWAFSTRGGVIHSQAEIGLGDGLLFGPETRGLPADVLDMIGPKRTLRLPMVRSNRSLNLSNAVAVGVYEALRTNGYPGMA